MFLLCNKYGVVMRQEQEKLIRSLIRRLVTEEKPGGGLTDWGAKRRVAAGDAMAQGRSAIEAADGDVEKAAGVLGVAPSTLYLAIQQEPSLEKSKEKADTENAEKENEKVKKESRRWRYYEMLLESEEAADEKKPPPDYAKKAAAKLAAAGEGGIGMLTQAYGQGVSIVLYKTNVFAGNVLANLDTEAGKGGDTQAIADAAEASIAGMLVLDTPDDECNNALMVKYISVPHKGKGYGAMLYDIGMQLSPSGKIISDRKATSDDARKLYMGMHQRGDIEKKPLDDNNIPMHKRKTPDDPSDDCEVWNHKGADPDSEYLDYSFKGSGNVDLSTLKKNHKEAMTIINRYAKDYLGWSESFASEYLNDISHFMFSNIYHKIPMEKRGLKGRKAG